MSRGNAIFIAVLAMLTMAILAGSARAQMMMRGAMGDPSGLLLLEQVQKELELVDDQKEKLKQVNDKFREEVRAAWGSLEDIKPGQREAKMAELRKQAETRSKARQKSLEDILLPHQLDRLKQISLQVQGDRALSNPEIIKALKITEKQQEQIKKIRTDMQERFRNAFRDLRGLEGKDRQKKVTEMRDLLRNAGTEARDKVFGLLTDEQKKKLEEMKGEKFELDRSQLFPRGGRPRPDGGRRAD